MFVYLLFIYVKFPSPSLPPPYYYLWGLCHDVAIKR